MNKENAKKIVESALDVGFDDNSFKIFISNLLKTPDLSEKPVRYENINEQFRAVISECLILGQYKDDQKNQLDILKITLHTESSLDKARTTQRNFIAHYLKYSSSDAAVVAFITPESPDWRFSLVKLEYIVEVENSKLKAKDEVTPAKRWSFLVGKNEGCHTAKSRFVPLLESELKPNLEEIQNAFNIEQVTDEFYRKYKDLFLTMKEELDALLSKDQVLNEDFQSKNIKTEDFAKKTLGQLAFIYFLQKKGWFGVKHKEKWGTGSKNFLRDLFNDRKKYGNNFFNDVLEWFFYEALSQDRGSDSIYSRFNCRIPFLNGGLFEPMNGYSWETTNIFLDDGLFSNNNETAEGDTGNGILDIFDRYNFTVNESEPLEKEVAVDPEMLGKVFENLLGVNDRKSKGAFYTPREIVHFICQESLALYLNNELKERVSVEDLRIFITTGAIENIKSFSKEIDDLIKNVKICDPAVGSGAFPLGMLNEIVKARQVLNNHLKNPVSKYQLKLDAISNSLYGVDLDSGAIEIAKLRMWLSLAVDEDEPRPLPNLDHKLMQGNSLVSKFYGEEPFDDDFLTNLKASNNKEAKILKDLNEIRSEYLKKIKNNQIIPKQKNEYDKKINQLEKILKELNSNFDKKDNLNLFEDQNTEVANLKIIDLKNKVRSYLGMTNRTEKERLKKEIDTIKWDLIELSLTGENDKEYLSSIHELRKKNEKPFFIWKLEFNEVFTEKEGFDIVIGNPPYVQIQKFSQSIIQDKLQDEGFETFSKTGDLYCLFYERGITLLRDKGVLSFITSNKWLKTGYGEKLRELFLRYNPKLLLNLGPNVFTSATVDTNIIFIEKSEYQNSFFANYISSEFENYADFYKSIVTDLKKLENLTSAPWAIMSEAQQELKLKIENTGTPLKKLNVKINRGILTGLTKAFIIDESKRNELITKNKNNLDIIKPLLRGKNISKYNFSFKNNYLLMTGFDIDIPNLYPEIYEHLLKYEKKAKARDDQGRNWYNLRACSYYDDFDKTKIIWPDIATEPSFTIVPREYYLNNTAYILTSDKNLYYILGILNSKLLKWFYPLISTDLGKNGSRYIMQFMENIPIPDITTSNSNAVASIEELVMKIINVPSSDFSLAAEEEINKIVYTLFDLTDDEIQIITG
jgi:hypothetical protein